MDTLSVIAFILLCLTICFRPAEFFAYWQWRPKKLTYWICFFIAAELYFHLDDRMPVGTAGFLSFFSAFLLAFAYDMSKRLVQNRLRPR